MKYLLPLSLAFLLAHPVIAADTPSVPTTANKIEGPVNGKLHDAIDLQIQNFGYIKVDNQESVSVSFCTMTYTTQNHWIGGRLMLNGAQRVCQTPDRMLHIEGQRQLTGITMTPNAEGEWRWEGDYRLVFTPKNPWPADQIYQVHFDPSIYADPVKFSGGGINFSTTPLMPSIATIEFFQDPNDIEKRGVSTSINLNMPVDEQQLKDHLKFTLTELTDAARPEDRKPVIKQDNMPYELKMSDDGTSANITTPITTMPDKEKFVSVTLSEGMTAKSGGKPSAKAMDNRTRIPSKYDYAAIDQVQLNVIPNEHYVPEQVLVISSNVPFTNEELAKHLQIYQLPKDKPVGADGKIIKDYSWSSANEVTDDILAKSAVVPYTLGPTADEAATLHSAKIDTDVNRWLYVRVSKDLTSKGGYVLARHHDDTVQVPAYTKEVRILSQGSLLSLSGEKKISIYSLGAQKLHVNMQRVMNDDINNLVSQTQGRFENPSFGDGYYNYNNNARHHRRGMQSYVPSDSGNFTADNISERFSEDIALPANDPRKPQFSSFDFTPYLTKNPQEKKWSFDSEPKGRGLFFVSLEAMAKDDKGKDTMVASDRRFVLVSDLGLVVKTTGSGTHEVFVQSVKTGDPMSGATVDVLGINGLPILSVKTDSEGHATVPNLQGYVNDKRPVAYVVRNDDDLAFMPFDDRDRSLNYSKFDTDGLRIAADQMHTYMFSDRGVYRPGEQTHIGIIVKQGDWSKNLADVPLQVEITNPRGQIIDRSTIRLNNVGFTEYAFTTNENSPTGTYQIRLYVASDADRENELGSTSVRVEEFLPDTLKITASLNKTAAKGWVTPEGLKATVNVQHLYGSPAIDHRVKAEISAEPAAFHFKEYGDYQFFDALKSGKSFDQPAGEAKTDADGNASFALDMTPFGNSTYQLTFEAEGFAQDSGRSVHAFSHTLVSSLPYVIGMRPNGNLGYLNKGEKHSVNLIALNPDLTPVDVSKMKLKLLQITYVLSLIRNEQGAYEYRSIPRETMVATGDFAIAAAGTNYNLDTAQPGTYAIVLSNNQDSVLQRFQYTVVGEGNLLGHVQKDATLEVKLDKPKYNPGDTIKMNIVSPYTGTGLITLETDKVLAFKWFKSQVTSSVQSIEIPKNFTGRGFVNVQFVRALDSKEIYTKPLSYHVEPFYVSTDSIDSQIALNVPEKAKPGDTITVQYKTRTPGKIIVYAVDEGILQYAQYKTPDPLSYYVNRRALQVDTTQILDMLMPEYSIMQSLSATGGGDGADLSKNLNPFKRKTQPPVVFWSGLIDSDATLHSLTYKVPDYFNGTLHVMAIAVSEQTMGTSEAKSFVQGDIIISPNVPTFAAPGDDFIVGVGVANNIKGSGKDAKIKLSLAPSEQLDILDDREREITVPEGKEAKAQVHVKAKDILGGATLTFSASAANINVHDEETLSVRPPLPSMTALISGYAEKGEKEVPQVRDIYKEFGSADAAVSTLPVSLVPGLQKYLDRYPYGCTEQTVSRAFPALILYGQKDLGPDQKTAEESVRNTMRRLSELQTAKGGFTYWWYGGDAEDFVSVYALHYMTLAKEKHLPVPDEVYRRAQDYVRNLVNNSPHSMDDARIQAYGIYILTREGVVTGNYLPNLVDYLEQQHKTEWKNDLAAVYIAASYKLMQLTPEANKMISEFALGDPIYWQAKSWYFDTAFYNNMDRYAEFLAVVADHFPDMLSKIDRNILFRVANFIGEGDYNTLSSSYAIMAFSAYGQATAAQTQGNVSISQKDTSGAWKPLPLTGELIHRAQLALDKSDIKFAGGGNYGLFYQLATDGYDRDKAVQPIEDGLEIKHEYLDSEHKPVTEAKLGDVINVVVTMRAHDNKTLESMALVDLLPAGFEIVPQSIHRPDATDDDDNADDSPTANNAKQTDNFGAAWSIEAVDAREDRVIAFGRVPPYDVVYVYKIKAVNAGNYLTPPAYVESMYDRSIKARGVTGTIAVK